MHLNRLLILLALITLTCSFSKSQGTVTLPLLEDSLKAVSKKIQASTSDSVKQLLNGRFREILKSAITLKGSFAYPFDSLKKLGKLTSPDKKFRMYNWNLPMADGSNRYFCLIQFRDQKSAFDNGVLELTDRTDTITDAEHRTLGAGSWFGALYYRIVPQKTRSGITYTLLGWQGINSSLMQKVIEIMTFNRNGLPVFGQKLFAKYKDGKNERVIFRYSSLAAMAVRYDEQFILKSRKWDVSKKAYKETRKKTRMIVCDRLIALEQNEVNNPVMVPAGDIYDGFIFENGQWNYIEGVDARNN